MLEQFKMVYLSGGSGSDAFRFVWTKVLPIKTHLFVEVYTASSLWNDLGDRPSITLPLRKGGGIDGSVTVHILSIGKSLFNGGVQKWPNFRIAKRYLCLERECEHLTHDVSDNALNCFVKHT